MIHEGNHGQRGHQRGRRPSKVDRKPRDGCSKAPDQRSYRGVLKGFGPLGKIAPNHLAGQQAVEVLAVWRPEPLALYEPAQHAVKHFDKRVGADHEAGPGRHAGVAHGEQNADPGQRKADEVGAAIAQEDLPPGVVHEPEARYCGASRQADDGQGMVAFQICQDGQGGEGHDAGTTGETMEAVDDVDGVGHAAHGEGGECDGERPPDQEVVNEGDVDAGERHAGEPAGQGAAEHGGEQAGQYRDALGQVFGQTKQPSGQTGHQEHADDVMRLALGRQEIPGHREPQVDADAADAGRGVVMGGLHRVRVVEGELAVVPSCEDHQQSHA